MIPALRRYYIENKNAPFIEVAPCCTFDKWSFTLSTFSLPKRLFLPILLESHCIQVYLRVSRHQFKYVTLQRIIGLNGLFQISEATKLSV